MQWEYFGQVTIIHQSNINLAAKLTWQEGDSLASISILLTGQGDTCHLAAKFFNSLDGERAPSSTNLQDIIRSFEAGFIENHLQLAHLSLVQSILTSAIRLGKHGTRIHHAVIQKLGKQFISNVIMSTDVGQGIPDSIGEHVMSDYVLDVAH